LTCGPDRGSGESPANRCFDGANHIDGDSVSNFGETSKHQIDGCVWHCRPLAEPQSKKMIGTMDQIEAASSKMRDIIGVIDNIAFYQHLGAECSRRCGTRG
jgi:hypothetical protein